MSTWTLAILLFWVCWALVAYTYIMFPLILAVIARFKGRAGSYPGEDLPTERLPRITMVVAAYNEASVLAAKLANTWALDYPGDRFVLVIGSDGSSDATADILQSCEDVRLRPYIFEERRGKISVLNDLMRFVDTEIVVMSDANTMFAPDSLRKLVRHFQDPAVGCVSGELSLESNGGTSGEGLYWKYEGWIKRNEGKLGFLIGCNGGIFAIRKQLYEALPSSTIVEDFVLTMRILERSYLVRFDPTARATEPPCSSARAEMVRKTRIGAGGWQSLALTRALMHPRYGLRAFAFWGHKILRWCVPLFLGLALTANLYLASSRVFSILLSLQLCGILLAMCAYYSSGAIRLSKWTRAISYFYLMNWALLCGFFRYLSKTQRVTWDRAASAVHTEAIALDAFAVASRRSASHPTPLPMEVTQQEYSPSGLSSLVNTVKR